MLSGEGAAAAKAWSDARPKLEKEIEDLLYIIGGAEVVLLHAGKESTTFTRKIRASQRKSEQKLKRLLNGLSED